MSHYDIHMCSHNSEIMLNNDKKGRYKHIKYVIELNVIYCKKKTGACTNLANRKQQF